MNAAVTAVVEGVEERVGVTAVDGDACVAALDGEIFLAYLMTYVGEWQG